MTRPPATRSAQPLPQWATTLIVILVLGAAYFASRAEREVVVEPAPPPPVVKSADRTEPQKPPAPTPVSTKSHTNATLKTLVRGVTIRDEDREVVYRGDIDLAPTLERIDDGGKLRFPNDGSTFQNREGRLPRKPSGHYREWVHPTPGLSGPGPQRVVTGEDGEAFYTPDHYRTFQRIR